MLKYRKHKKVSPQIKLNRNDPIQARIHENILMLQKKKIKIINKSPQSDKK